MTWFNLSYSTHGKYLVISFNSLAVGSGYFQDDLEEGEVREAGEEGKNEKQYLKLHLTWTVVIFCRVKTCTVCFQFEFVSLD